MYKTTYDFYGKVMEVLAEIKDTQTEAIQKAADIVAEVISKDGLLYILGSGHSLMPAAEAYYRAGGLAPVDIIHDKTFGRAERLSGYAKILLDDYMIPAGGVIVIFSNSGINALGIEMALEAGERGIRTIAITSLKHSKSQTTRHPSGKKLYEIADVVIDNCGVPGDAILDIDGLQGKTCPTSTISGTFIMDCIVATTIENLIKMGITPPTFISANVAGGDEHNKVLLDKYWKRIRGL